MEIKKYPIPQRHLDTAIEGLKELAQRLEIEAAAFAQLHTPEASELAQERIEQAQTVEAAYDYFLGL